MSLGLLKVLAPQLPFIFKSAALHTFGYAPTSGVWDLKTELTVGVIRNMLTNPNPMSITKQQKMINKHLDAKGNVWVSAVNLPIPTEDDLQQLVFKAVQELSQGDEEYNKACTIEPLYAEWNGYRADAKKDTPLPKGMSEADLYKALLKENPGKPVYLYFHGGGYFMMDPSGFREFTSKLAKMFEGRAYNIRYRLAPQHPFPAALMDALHAYLSLLYPPEGSPHEPVDPSNIVFGGDSAGGNLATVLLLLITHLHQKSDGQIPTMKYNGKTVEIPLPAGAALLSPWMDQTRGLPSIMNNAYLDYLPPPRSDGRLPPPPKCEAWPVSPPRATLFCEGSALLHPLVSPITNKSWKGCPPVFILSGEEMHADEDALVAQAMAHQDVTVVWEFFEKMPHVFPFVFAWLPESTLATERLVDFVKNVTSNPSAIQTKGARTVPKTLERHDVDVKNWSSISEEEMYGYMRKAQQKIIDNIPKPEANAVPML